MNSNDVEKLNGVTIFHDVVAAGICYQNSLKRIIIYLVRRIKVPNLAVVLTGAKALDVKLET